MNKTLAAVLGFLPSMCITFPSEAGQPALEGEPFSTKAAVIWAATNSLPSTFGVYEADSYFKQSAISNAMTIGGFKPINLIPSSDKALLHFQDNRDRTYMTRFLKISDSLRY